MDRETFENIKERAEQFTYTSMKYTDFDEVEQYNILYQEDTLLLLYGFNNEKNFHEYHWACNNAEDILNKIDKSNKNVQVSFVPREWTEQFRRFGFTVYAVYNDYFNPDIRSLEETTEPELLTEKDCEAAALVTQSCREQSRGFHGETAAWMKSWINGEEPAAQETGVRNSAVVIHREKKEIAGIVCTATYAHDSVKGPVSWIREVAVQPDYQNRGIAYQLIRQAMAYGKKHGAVRAFLMADECNEPAIHLYEKLGFIADKDECQIDMILL